MILEFGKYRGRRIDEIPISYLQWLLTDCGTVTPRLRRAIRQQLESSKSRPQSPVLGIVVDEWYRTLAVQFHPDRGGSHDAMVAINAGRDLLIELAGN